MVILEERDSILFYNAYRWSAGPFHDVTIDYNNIEIFLPFKTNTQ
tara:strand:- start:30 stop:164 length:135 start_codon:yes stop_codon:yes gene_type:complete